ncbi:MAG: hypothetical protein U1A78_25740 [Polyangia bacterium]
MSGPFPLRRALGAVALLVLLWPGPAAASPVAIGPLGGVFLLCVLAFPVWLISLAATLVSAVKGRVNLVARILAVLDLCAVLVLLVAALADPPKTSDDLVVACLIGGLPLAVAAWTLWIWTHPRARPRP